jgi:D-alanine-D-alanine ligase
MLDVNLLCGGRSLEHAVSCGMYDYMREQLAEVDSKDLRLCTVFYIDRQGRLLHLRVGEGPLPSLAEVRERGSVCSLLELGGLMAASGAFTFSLLQGQDGEDGTIQGVGRFFDLPCNCAPPGVVGLAFDKDKQSLLAEAMCPTLLEPMRGVCVQATHWQQHRAELNRLLGQACVLKPNQAGSSVGVQLCENLTESYIAEYAAGVSEYDDWFVVQPYIGGREITVGVLWSSEAEEFIDLPTIEIRTTGQVFGFTEKWSSGTLNLSLIEPADESSQKAEQASRHLFRSLGLQTHARFDYRIDDSGRVFFLEVNTSPGLMASSLFTRMLRARGKSVVDLIRFAYIHYGQRQKREQLKRRTIAAIRGAGHERDVKGSLQHSPAPQP